MLFRRSYLEINQNFLDLLVHHENLLGHQGCHHNLPDLLDYHQIHLVHRMIHQIHLDLLRSLLGLQLAQDVPFVLQNYLSNLFVLLQIQRKMFVIKSNNQDRLTWLPYLDCKFSMFMKRLFVIWFEKVKNILFKKKYLNNAALRNYEKLKNLKKVLNFKLILLSSI